MHSHLLPSLDDGLKELDQTVSFVKELNALGYHSLVCTPHILSDLYPNSPDTILPTVPSFPQSPVGNPPRNPGGNKVKTTS